MEAIVPTEDGKQPTTEMDTLDAPAAPPTQATIAATAANAKTLKRCLSVPTIHTLPGKPGMIGPSPPTAMTTRSAAAAAAAAKSNTKPERLHETPKKYQHPLPDSSTSSSSNSSSSNNIYDYFGKNIHIRSNPSSREVSPAPVFNIFSPRTRRYSASYSPMAGAVGASAAAAVSGAPLCLTPRVSQLRQEECVDINSREVNHEREVHTNMQMSQSWEDLTLVAENWSCKSDEFSNPLQVALPSGITSCSSPSPTNNRSGLRLPYSPSPTRRTFATRRSMSPIPMRPSQLGAVKRKFELDDNNCSNWNICSPPPLKKIFTESRGSSPICQSPSSICPSPDSGTYDGRCTPKLFISKLCTNNSSSSACSSPMSASPCGSVGMSGGLSDSAGASTSNIFSSSSSSSSTASSTLGGCEAMCTDTGGINNSNNIDEGISVSESEDKQSTASSVSSLSQQRALSTSDIQDDATLMDDLKSETSSIGGCSSISIESSSCDSGAKTAANFLNKLVVDDSNIVTNATPLTQKSFYINKQGLSGAKKFIVNHENLSNSVGGNISGSGGGGGVTASKSEPLASTKVSSTTSGSTSDDIFIGGKWRCSQ